MGCSVKPSRPVSSSTSRLISTERQWKDLVLPEATLTQLEEIKHRIMAMGELYNHLYTSLEFGSIRLDEVGSGSVEADSGYGEVSVGVRDDVRAGVTQLS